MDSPLSRWQKSAVLLVLCLAPLVAMRGEVWGRGLLGVIQFGKNLSYRLPEIDQVGAPLWSGWGYDGQYYAQTALDPLLLRPDLPKALDNARYRARRIGLPAAAHVVGFGRTLPILYALALFNPLCWLALLAMLYARVGLERPRDALLFFGLLWTSGTLASISRALPDLPAAAMGVFALAPAAFTGVGGAAAFSGFGGLALLSFAALCKETSVLSIPAGVSPTLGGPGLRGRATRLALAATAAAPLALWLAYVHWRIPGGGEAGVGNFTPPGEGLIQKLSDATAAIFTVDKVRLTIPRVFELLGPLSLLVQASYLLGAPRRDDPFWRFGAGFAVLLLFLGPAVWAEQAAYTRVLLPLTFAFNLLVHRREEGVRYHLWFWIGNLGTSWGWLKTFF